MNLPPLARELPIPAAVLALPQLTLTARLVLAEVLDLVRLTGTASAPNAYYAQRLGCAVRTVGSALAELEAAGHLVRHFAPTGLTGVPGRTLRPAPPVPPVTPEQPAA